MKLTVSFKDRSKGSVLEALGLGDTDVFKFVEGAARNNGNGLIDSMEIEIKNNPRNHNVVFALAAMHMNHIMSQVLAKKVEGAVKKDGEKG